MPPLSVALCCRTNAPQMVVKFLSQTNSNHYHEKTVFSYFKKVEEVVHSLCLSFQSLTLLPLLLVIKRSHVMLIFIFINVIWERALHTLRFACCSAQKTCWFSHTVQRCSTVFLVCLKCSNLAPVSLRPPSLYPLCSDWSAHEQQQSS